MTVSAPVRNDYVLTDMATDVDMVKPIVERLAQQGLIYHPGDATTGIYHVVNDVWSLTPQSLLRVVRSDILAGDNPITKGTVPAMLYRSPAPGGFDVGQLEKHFLTTDLDTLAAAAAKQLVGIDKVQDEHCVSKDANGNNRLGWVNCPLIVVHSDTAETIPGFYTLIQAIRHRQEQITKEDGISLPRLQIFVHNGTQASLRPLGE